MAYQILVTNLLTDVGYTFTSFEEAKVKVDGMLDTDKSMVPEDIGIFLETIENCNE